MRKGVGIGLLVGVAVGALLATPAGREAAKKAVRAVKQKWEATKRAVADDDVTDDEERRVA